MDFAIFGKMGLWANMPMAITTRLAMLSACRGEPRVTPTFLAMANGQIKGVGNARKGTRVGDMKRSFVCLLQYA